MATRQVRTDDIDGSDATHSAAIIFGGVRHNLDLNDKHFEEFSGDVKKYIDAAKAKKARQATTGTTAAKKKSNEPPAMKVVTMSDGTPVDKDAARIWAKDNGWPKIGMFVGPTVLEEYRDWVEAGRPEPEEPQDDEGGEE